MVLKKSGNVNVCLDWKGIQADLSKTSAINELPTPQSLTELYRFMGMANQLGKYFSKIGKIIHHYVSS